MIGRNEMMDDYGKQDLFLFIPSPNILKKKEKKILSSSKLNDLILMRKAQK